MKGARLEVSDPMGGTRVVPIKDNRFTIRRGYGNSLSLNGTEISRVHAEIVKDGDRFILRVDPAGALEFALARGRGPATRSSDTFRTSRKLPEQVLATGEPQLVAGLHGEMFAEAHMGHHPDRLLGPTDADLVSCGLSSPGRGRRMKKPASFLLVTRATQD